MDKYKKLAANTIIVGIGSFSSKLLVFFLMPITTRLLTTAEMGSYYLAFNAASLLYPIVSFGIANAILRFGLDKNEDKTGVFSTGIFACLAGLALLLVFTPLLSRVGFISNNVLSIFLYVCFATIHAVCSNFIRACEQIKLYAVDGILSAVLTIIFTVLFLAILKMGVSGYLFATTVSNIISIAFLFVRAKLYRYLRLRNLNRKIALMMLKYSMPLIPSMIFWWITSVSDQFLVKYFWGADATGLYAISNKAPQIIVLISNIFSDAWLISAVTQDDKRGRDHFFTKVFQSYGALTFITASGLIMCAQLVTHILVAPSFYESWRYMPILVVATVFSCLVTFLQSIYFVEKKSVLSLVTIFAGALVNVILNLFLIPAIGINGAALSTLVCYVLVFVLRAVNTGKYIKIRFNILMLSVNSLIISVQSYLIISEIKYWPYYEAALFLAMALLNMKPLLLSVKRIAARQQNQREDTMEITIRALSPELFGDYFDFFDRVAFSDHAEWAGCYCMFYHLDPANDQEFDDCKVSDRRVIAEKMLRSGTIRGYLAYNADKVVGWCNANDRNGFKRLRANRDLLWDSDEKVKSVVCFLIAPDWRGKGIATALLRRVCDDAAAEGYDFAEGYPSSGTLDSFKHYHGHPAMFEKASFETVRECHGYSIVRKKLR